ncbi:hypothetical protein PC116_g22773 [Phytophthora cactorum]|nr:hypothetical protein PC116_g22773 [Phytophthora cactorum]
MVALQTIKNRTELRRHTCFAPLRANATRWSSTFMMLERYVRIRDTIKRVDAVYDLVSRGTEADLTPEELQALNPFELEAAASKPTLPSRSSRARTRARSDAEDFAAALLQSRPIPEQLTPRSVQTGHRRRNAYYTRRRLEHRKQTVDALINCCNSRTIAQRINGII